MFLEKGIFPVHMGAVEKSISVNDIVPESFSNICGIVIFFALYIVFVTRNVFSLAALILFSLCAFDRSNLLVPAKSIIQINEYVGAIDLDEGLISSFEEDSVLFVKVREHFVAKDLVDHFPVAGDHTLFIQVDKVDLH
jgi:hypothetical protein